MTEKMDPVLLEKWRTALLSDKYEQADGCLRSEQDGKFEHCCLGVFLDVVDPEGWGDEPERQTHRLGDGEAYLSDEFCQSVGLPTRYAYHLAALNDSTHSLADIGALLSTGEMHKPEEEWVGKTIANEYPLT